jgi:glycosyltransferase involved in cell wall biosynthesis
MKDNLIFISNPARQHTTHLLYSITLNKYSVFWYTSFWFNPKNWFWRIFLSFFPLLKSQFLKRYSALVIDHDIRFNVVGMLLFFFSRFLFLTEKRNFIEDRWHDFWVLNIIKKNKPTIFIGSEKSSLRSFLECKKYGSTIILDLAGNNVESIESLRESFPFYKASTGSNSLFKTIKKIKKQELEIVDKIFVLSQLVNKNLINSGVPSSKIHVFNLGFDPIRFYAKNEYSSSFSQSIKIIYTGIITKRKGVHLMSNVAKRLQHLSIEWVFIGSKDDAFDCINGLPNSRYIPYLQHDKLVKELHASDIFVLPSYLDSWGMVVIEAMACGLPVIVSENTGAKDAVTNDSGFVIPINDEDALMDKVLYFYNNRAEIERMGKNATSVVQKYTWDNYYKQVNDFIDTIKVKI